MTRLLLWRHGRTAWNAEHRVQGQTDVPLDETGQAQADVAARRLAALSPDLLLSSDLRRATSTAAPLAQLTGLPMRLDPRLRERCYGEWQGLTLPEIQQRWPEAFARWRAGEVVGEAGVESTDDVGKRAGDALRDVADQTAGATIVVVAHGGSLKRGIAALLGWSEPVLRTVGEFGNCRWSELRHRADRGWQLIAHNID